MSLPSWERGLKSHEVGEYTPFKEVAPLVGAWIEIDSGIQMYNVTAVAPLVGAWIEIQNLKEH